MDPNDGDADIADDRDDDDAVQIATDNTNDNDDPNDDIKLHADDDDGGGGGSGADGGDGAGGRSGGGAEDDGELEDEEAMFLSVQSQLKAQSSSSPAAAGGGGAGGGDDLSAHDEPSLDDSANEDSALRADDGDGAGAADPSHDSADDGGAMGDSEANKSGDDEADLKGPTGDSDLHTSSADISGVAGGGARNALAAAAADDDHNNSGGSGGGAGGPSGSQNTSGYSTGNNTSSHTPARLGVAGLTAQFADLMATNELLAKENRLFDSYLHRHAGDQQDLHENKAYRKKKSEPQQLTQYQKYQLSVQEHDYRTKQLQALEVKAQEDISLLRAITEGIRIRINEMRKETYEFKRDIVIGGENMRTGKIMAEKVVRYFEEKLKQKNGLIDKLKLKNAAMKQHRQKMDLQVKHKEEQGDSLHSIDFHQLQIKNSQFNQKITERNNELLRLKMTTGKTVQVLNTAKRKLNELLAESKRLKKDIKDRELSLGKLDEELNKVQSEVEGEKKRNKKFKVQQSNPDMPQVLDYVTQKSTMYDLEAEVRNWERKVEIVEMAAKRARKILKNLEAKGFVMDDAQLASTAPDVSLLDTRGYANYGGLSGFEEAKTIVNPTGAPPRPAGGGGGTTTLPRLGSRGRIAQA